MRRRGVELTDEVAQTVIDGVAKGNFLDVAFALAGVGRETMREWLVRGKGGEEPYVSLTDAIAQTEAFVEGTALATMVEKSREDPRVAREFLASRFPERWAEKRTLVHEVPGQLTDERLKVRLREMAAELSPEVRAALGPEWLGDVVVPPRGETH